MNLNTYLADSLNKKTVDFQRPRELENKMGGTKKTNLTISEVDEEEKIIKIKPLEKKHFLK